MLSSSRLLLVAFHVNALFSVRLATPASENVLMKIQCRASWTLQANPLVLLFCTWHSCSSTSVVYKISQLQK